MRRPAAPARQALGRADLLELRDVIRANGAYCPARAPASAPAREAPSMKAGIAVDDWKLPVFRRRLAAAGYSYQDGGAPTPGVTLLTVQTDDILKLKRVLEQCQAECAKQERP
jgi:hypothetical protein